MNKLIKATFEHYADQLAPGVHMVMHTAAAQRIHMSVEHILGLIFYDMTYVSKNTRKRQSQTVVISDFSAALAQSRFVGPKTPLKHTVTEIMNVQDPMSRYHGAPAIDVGEYYQISNHYLKKLIVAFDPELKVTVRPHIYDSARRFARMFTDSVIIKSLRAMIGNGRHMLEAPDVAGI
eukprot:12419955-Karenia_brevis.AAC.1